MLTEDRAVVIERDVGASWPGASRRRAARRDYERDCDSPHEAAAEGTRHQSDPRRDRREVHDVAVEPRLGTCPRARPCLGPGRDGLGCDEVLVGRPEHRLCSSCSHVLTTGDEVGLDVSESAHVMVQVNGQRPRRRAVLRASRG